ncbi:MAG: hypothetical protein KAS30_00205 [Candidatus Diapherotrites archaeon]|nr:hypothetical protein [Candidatus Diapherotrites archaeon]
MAKITTNAIIIRKKSLLIGKKLKIIAKTAIIPKKIIIFLASTTTMHLKETINDIQINI